MGVFSKIFSKKTSGIPKGFQLVKVKSVEQLTPSMVKIVFDSNVQFNPGQFIDISVDIDGKNYRRSYSICSTQNENLSVAVKRVENGVVSNWLCDNVHADTELAISNPNGSFGKDVWDGNYVFIAAGSGITPILSMLAHNKANSKLFYGNKSKNEIAFKNQLENLNVDCTYYLSQEDNTDHKSGRINKENFTSEIKSNLDLLKADGFYICGPEEMIVSVKETLELFGVSEDKIHFELFATPTLLVQNKTEEATSFEGNSQVKVKLGGDVVEFELNPEGSSILDAVNDEGLDAPYSCMGGVCSTCRAKVIEGKASMKLNYALTDKEVEDGYILTCQAHPASENLKISYDD